MLLDVVAPVAPPALEVRCSHGCKKGFLKTGMGTNLFVGNLSYDVNDTDLAQLFARAGTVTRAQVITDKFSGQSRGYGFVEMSTEAETTQAVTLLNGQELQGRALTVNEARPREARSGGYGGDRRNGGGRSRY